MDAPFSSIEIKALSSSIQVVFKNAGRSANGMADFSSKRGVDRAVHLIAHAT